MHRAAEVAFLPVHAAAEAPRLGPEAGHRDHGAPPALPPFRHGALSALPSPLHEREAVEAPPEAPQGRRVRGALSALPSSRHAAPSSLPSPQHERAAAEAALLPALAAAALFLSRVEEHNASES